MAVAATIRMSPAPWTVLLSSLEGIQACFGGIQRGIGTILYTTTSGIYQDLLQGKVPLWL